MILIPMAGRSSRFFKAGFTKPKYMLPLGPRHDGVSVFRACIDSFKAYFGKETFVFVHLDEPGVREFLDAELKKAGVPEETCHFVALGETTSGQAETVALGVQGVPGAQDDDLTIFNIDTIRPNYRKPDWIADQGVAGYLEVVEAEGDHWSFARADVTGDVVEVTEKKRISDLCSTGLYYFRRASDFLDAYRATLSKDVATLQGGERYVAPLYNALIAQGMRIRYDLITMKDVQFSGTPDEYHALIDAPETSTGQFAKKPACQPVESKASPSTNKYPAPIARRSIDDVNGVEGPWGANSNLTVLLHGNYTEANRVDLVEVITSWRRLLPGAQIGFAASEIDKNITEAERDLWRHEDVEHLDDKRARLIRSLKPELDFLVEGRPMNALAPLKFDDKANNCNKMIASIQAGLSMVDTPWVLRIRSDATIRHPARMIKDYDHFARHVGTPKAFKQPVAVCPYYTINPLGLERMSFHVSDWYNLGLTEDVRDYWNIAPMSSFDATYFEGVPHADHTNRFEAPMRARMPPEMMIGTTFADRHGYKVPSYFNELGYESEGLAFIRENFVLPDPNVIGMSMPKYARERRWIITSLLIISPEEWRVLAQHGEAGFRKAVAHKSRLIKLAEKRRDLNFMKKIRRSTGFRSIGWVLKS